MMPRWPASGSAARRANSAGSTSWSPASGAGPVPDGRSCMIGPYDLRVPPPLRAMTPRSFLLSQELSDYVRAGSGPADEVVRELIAETAALAERGEARPTFQIAPEEAAFLQLLTAAAGARRA